MWWRSIKARALCAFLAKQDLTSTRFLYTRCAVQLKGCSSFEFGGEVTAKAGKCKWGSCLFTVAHIVGLKSLRLSSHNNVNFYSVKNRNPNLISPCTTTGWSYVPRKTWFLWCWKTHTDTHVFMCGFQSASTFPRGFITYPGFAGIQLTRKSGVPQTTCTEKNRDATLWNLQVYFIAHCIKVVPMKCGLCLRNCKDVP